MESVPLLSIQAYAIMTLSLLSLQICHNKSGDINPSKIQSLVIGYVNKFKYSNRKRKV